MAAITHLECSRCGHTLSADEPQTVCPRDAGPLYVRYDLKALRSFDRGLLAVRPPSMWRYGEVLPDAEPVTLGEGFTPLLASRRHAAVFIKDEGLNPTGTFKARGMAMAATMARHYGLRDLAAPSAGNAAGALAAYAAAAGLKAHIFMPRDVPRANLVECLACGAEVTLVDGLISDCAKLVRQGAEAQGWFDVSSLKEPFRVEGKKTMGYEVAEQLGWRLPSAIIYPTGGGVGLIGMWKAFTEMEEMGWVQGKRPRMITVQSSGCAPIVKAFDDGAREAPAWPQAATLAAGLRVPKAYGDFLILNILRESGGTAVAVSDDEILGAVSECAREEGVFASPEGASSLAAYRKLRREGFLKEGETVVLFNTGSGLKYIDVLAPAMGASSGSRGKVPRRLGGIIGPY